MTIEQMLLQLEQQKTSIERAIAALREVSRSGIQTGSVLSAPAATTEAKKRRGRPPKNAQQPSPAAGEQRSARQSSSEGAAAGGQRKRPVYTDDFRRRVVSAVSGGMSFGEAAKKFNTTWFSVREWVNSGKFAARAPQKSGPSKTSGSANRKTTGAKKRKAARKSTRTAKSAPTPAPTKVAE